MKSEISQAEKDKHHMISLTCGRKKTKQTNHNENRLIKKKYVAAKGKGDEQWGELGTGD